MKRRDLVGKVMGLAAAGTLLNLPGARAGTVAENATGTKPGAASGNVSGDGLPANIRLSDGNIYDVRKYGAAGDGKKDDAAAIQKAIDECAQNGGGMVLLHNGTFFSGGIVFRSNVELHISSTAVLVASEDISKHNSDHKFDHGEPVRSFIHGDGCHHIAITGSGKIEGQGHLFEAGGSYSVRPLLIQLRACTDVRIRDILLSNSAVWACWLLQCHHVKVDGVRIDNPISPNRDGIDIDGCTEVIISNCNIKTEDDSIAFKVSQKGFPCRNIVVTNCILSSRCAAIRLGPDAADNIENVTVSNCVIRDTRLNGIKIQEALGAVIRNITFSNIVMDNVRGPISIRLAGWKVKEDEPTPFKIDDSDWEMGKLQNVLFENIQATMPDDNICMSITGTTKTRPQQITFSNLDFTFAGGGTAEQGARREVPDLDRHYPEMYIFGELPAYALYIHHASGIVLNNVQFRLRTDDLRPAIVCDDVDDLELSACRIAGSKNAESLIRLQHTKNVFIQGSRTLTETGTFLRVEGSASSDIVVAGNRLDKVRKITEFASGAVKKSVVAANNINR